LNNTINLRHLIERFMSCYTHKMAILDLEFYLFSKLQSTAMSIGNLSANVVQRKCKCYLPKSEMFVQTVANVQNLVGIDAVVLIICEFQCLAR